MTISIELFHLFSTSLFSLLVCTTHVSVSVSLFVSTGWVGRSSQSTGIGRTKRSFKCTTSLVHDILQFHQFPVSKYFTLCFHQICLFRQSCWVCGSLERPGEGMTKRRRGRPRSQRRPTAGRCRPTHTTMTHSSLWVRGGRTVDLSGGFAQCFAFKYHHKKFKQLALWWNYHPSDN